MRSLTAKIFATIGSASVGAPILAYYILAILEGHDSLEFWPVELGSIPFWIFVPIFVLPFTFPAAAVLCFGSYWLGSKTWNRALIRIFSFAFLGLVCSLPFPAFLTFRSGASSFDASPYGVTAHDQAVFLIHHWIATGLSGLTVGIILNFVWRQEFDEIEKPTKT